MYSTVTNYSLFKPNRMSLIRQLNILTKFQSWNLNQSNSVVGEEFSKCLVHILYRHIVIYCVLFIAWHLCQQIIFIVWLSNDYHTNIISFVFKHVCCFTHCAFWFWWRSCDSSKYIAFDVQTSYPSVYHMLIEYELVFWHLIKQTINISEKF